MLPVNGRLREVVIQNTLGTAFNSLEQMERAKKRIDIIPSLNIALPPQLCCVDIEVPSFPIGPDCVCWAGTKDLWSILGIQVLRSYRSWLGLWSRARATCNEDVTLNRSRQDTEERVVDVLPCKSDLIIGDGSTISRETYQARIHGNQLR